MPVKTKRARVTKRDWLQAALEMLELSGVDSIRVERLARNLNISKSGFYWHFKDRNELLYELLIYWREEYTKIAIDTLKDQNLDPLARLDQVVEMVWKHDLAKYDLSIRTWAKNDPIAHRAVTKVTKLRLDYLRKIFYELGFRGDNLEVRAMLCLSYMTLEISMYGKMSRKKWERLNKLKLKLLLQKISTDHN